MTVRTEKKIHSTGHILQESIAVILAHHEVEKNERNKEIQDIRLIMAFICDIP